MNSQSRGRLNRLGDITVTSFEALLVVLAVIFVSSKSLEALVAWELAALAYLVIGLFVTQRVDSVQGSGGGRVGTLDTLSWVLPLVASLVGVSAAGTALLGRGGTPDAGPLSDVTLGAIGIILSWLLLQTGFARVYESAHARRGEGLSFPRTQDPLFGDFLYFAFGLGTFAHTDADVQTRQMRWIILVHSVLSFFYNALVVAVAIDVLQRLVVGQR